MYSVSLEQSVESRIGSLVSYAGHTNAQDSRALSVFDAAFAARHRRIESVARQRDLTVRFVGSGPAFEDWRLYQGPNLDWALMPLERDPSYIANRRRLVAPQRILDQLARITQAGLDFDAIYIAHEAPSGALHADLPIESQVIVMPTSSAMEVRRDKLADHSDWLGPISGTALGMAHVGSRLARLGRTQTELAITSARKTRDSVAKQVAEASAAMMTRWRLDPILFGVNVGQGVSQRDARSPQGAWYYLAHWVWE
jgi:hypothetical protein